MQANIQVSAEYIPLLTSLLGLALTNEASRRKSLLALTSKLEDLLKNE